MKKKTQKQSKTKEFKSNFDPFGAYTGNSVFGGRPVQDADDL